MSQQPHFSTLREAFPDLTQSTVEKTWIETNGDPGKFTDVCLNIPLIRAQNNLLEQTERQKQMEQKLDEARLKEEQRHQQKAENLTRIADLERMKREQTRQTGQKDKEESIQQLLFEKETIHQKERERNQKELEMSYVNLEKLRQQKEERLRELQEIEETLEKVKRTRERADQEKQELEKILQEREKLQQLEKQATEEAKRLKDEVEKQQREQLKEIESLRTQREAIKQEKKEKLSKETEEERPQILEDDLEESFIITDLDSSFSSKTYETGIVRIFFKTDQNKLIEEAKEIVTAACPAPLEHQHFLIQNYCYDLELMAFLKAKCNRELPIAISINSHFVGDLEALKKLSFDQILSMLDEKPEGEREGARVGPSEGETENEEEPALGVLDTFLNVTEYLVSGVSTVALSPVTGPYWALTSLWNSLTGGAKGEDVRDQEKFEDFEVIHTNWYWRHLRRIFRFTNTTILRFHPKYLDNIRAAHEYKTVGSLEIVDPQNLIIVYNDSSPSDYIRTKPTQIQKIVNIIFQRTESFGKLTIVNEHLLDDRNLNKN